MSVLDQFNDVMAVSQRLGLDPSRVRVLAEQGRLNARKIGSRWLIDIDSVSEFAMRQRSAGRPYSPRNAWSMIHLAVGKATGWLSSEERYRLRQSLDRRGLAQQGGRLELRQRVSHWHAHPSALKHLHGEAALAPAGVELAVAAGIGILPAEELDRRVAESHLDDLVKQFNLEASPRLDSNVCLRAVPDHEWDLATSAPPRASAALDLASDFDARSRRVGSAELKLIDEARAWRVR